MPLYECQCAQCETKFEVLTRSYREYEEGKAAKRIACPNCQSREHEQIVSLCAFKMTSPAHGSYRGDRANAFENFTVQNVRDEKGRKVKVNSLKELRAAEQKYNFSLDIASADRGTAEEAPQNKEWAGDVTHGYDWHWARDPVKRAESMASPIVKLDIGIAASQKETLAGRDS
jgi:hypothetical protein